MHAADDAELSTIIDWIRYGASCFTEAGLTFGHSYDNALDEATQLVLHALQLPHDLGPAYGQARLLAHEKAKVRALFERRLTERIPTAYLTGETWFAGLCLHTDARALVPRSPLAELIDVGFEPWLNGRSVRCALDLCTGSGCIALAMANNQPNWQIDGSDVSAQALALAAENQQALQIPNVSWLQSDLYSGLYGRRYQLIVTNPPYVPDSLVDTLPKEYTHEPSLGLRAGADGLDLILRILRDAPNHLDEHGLFVGEVGEAEQSLTALLPDLDVIWVECQHGQMGVFVAEAVALQAQNDCLAALVAQRSGQL